MKVAGNVKTEGEGGGCCLRIYLSYRSLVNFLNSFVLGGKGITENKVYRKVLGTSLARVGFNELYFFTF